MTLYTYCLPLPIINRVFLTPHTSLPRLTGYALALLSDLRHGLLLLS
jgi:hypothetical protein